MKNQFVSVFIVILAVTLLPAPLHAQTDSILITVTDITEAIHAPMGNNYHRLHFALTPDTARLAWITEGAALCLHTYAAEETICTSLPSIFPHQGWTRASFVWLPTQDYILLENSDVLGENTALWLYDVQADTFTNVVQHHLAVRGHLHYIIWAGLDRFYLSKYVAFARDDIWPTTLTLYQLDPATSRLQMLIDLGDPNMSNEPTVITVAPDGQRMALLMRRRTRPEDEWFDYFYVSLWMLDLTTNTLSEIATQKTLQVGVPADSNHYFYPHNLAWSADGTALIVEMRGLATTRINILATYVSLDQPHITPILDLSTLTQEQWWNWQGVTRAGAITPDGRFFFYMLRTGNDKQLWMIPTAPDQPTPIPVTGEFEFARHGNYLRLTVQTSTQIEQYVVYIDPQRY